jgi:hypothetical protein
MSWSETIHELENCDCVGGVRVVSLWTGPHRYHLALCFPHEAGAAHCPVRPPGVGRAKEGSELLPTIKGSVMRCERNTRCQTVERRYKEAYEA